MVLCTAVCRAFSEAGFALLNIASLLEMLERRASIDFGILLVIVGGWLDSVCT